MLLNQCPPWRPLHPLAASDLRALEAYLSAVHLIADGSVGVASWRPDQIRFHRVQTGDAEALECSVADVRGLTRAGLPVWLNGDAIRASIPLAAPRQGEAEVDVWIAVNPESDKDETAPDMRKWRLLLAPVERAEADPACEEDRLFLGRYAIAAGSGSVEHCLNRRPAVMRLNTLAGDEWEDWVAPLGRKLDNVRTSLTGGDGPRRSAAAIAIERLVLTYPRLTIRALADELQLIAELLGGRPQASSFGVGLSEVVSDSWPEQLASLLGEPDLRPPPRPEPPPPPPPPPPTPASNGIRFSRRGNFRDGRGVIMAAPLNGLENGTYDLRITGFDGDIQLKHSANNNDINMENIGKTVHSDGTTYRFTMGEALLVGEMLSIVAYGLPDPNNNYSLFKVDGAH